jgi:UDP-N-acetylmuramoylalanine--D-glutamate ligase
MLASILVARTAGASEDRIRKAILSFKGLPHRFETVATIGGVEYIDDSKGTTVDSTYRALESCTRPVVLIAGGRDKKSDYSVIRELVNKKVRHLILVGEAGDRIRSILGGATNTHEAKTMEDAVRKASALAGAGEIVLLSPMCSSFDMFTSYKHRGDVFKAAVRGLKEVAAEWKN